MRLEHVTRRVIGAMRMVDVNTGLQLPGPFLVEADDVRFVRNGKGYYVIFEAPGFDRYIETFDEAFDEAFDEIPDTPALGSVPITVTVTDPAGRYLSRRQTILVPRDPSPDNADQEGSLFRPAEVTIFPSPTAPTMPGWAVIRATVTDVPDAVSRPFPLPGALIRVMRASDSGLLAQGISNWRGRTAGEAMVIIPGLPITTWSDGDGDEDDGDGDGDTAVLVTEIQLNVDVIYDPDFNPDAGDIPDPADLAARSNVLPSAQFSFAVASGQTLTRTFSVPLTE